MSQKRGQDFLWTCCMFSLRTAGKCSDLEKRMVPYWRAAPSSPELEGRGHSKEGLGWKYLARI